MFVAYALKTRMNAHPVIFSEAIGLNLDPSLYLHPYFEYASSEGSGKMAYLDLT